MKKIITLLFVLASLTSFSQSTTLVISQVYGAGGNSTAIYNADYVELHNISGAAISLSGYSIQYASATATGDWTGVSPLPAASIPAGGYYLIQMTAAGSVGVALPAVDYAATPTISMSAANGRVALVNGIAPLTACPASGYVDLVGYGTSICFEGAAATPAISAILAAFRNNNGCTDTNNNGADFSVAAPLPRNSASPVSVCGVVSPSLSVTTVNDFGNVLVGSNSTSQTYTLSGVNLTGAPGVITVTAPSADFQVSNDNIAWGSSTTIPYTSATLTGTPVYVRFTPQSAGPKSGNVTNTGGGVTVAVNVPVSGNGELPTTPVLSAGALSGFGDVCLNTTPASQSFTLTGLNLTTTDITVGPLAGFTFSTTNGGTYTPTLTLTQTGGSYTQEIFVAFTPVAGQSYNGNIPVSGGGAPAINVAATGTGANSAPSVTTGAASAITTNTATLAGNIGSIGCSAITAYGVEYSTTNGFVTGTQVSATNLSGGDFSSDVSGLLPSTTYYYKAYATNSGGTTYGVQLSFTTAAPSFTATNLTAFGNVCVNVPTDASSFTLTSTSLTAADVTVGPLAGYTFATTAAGPFTATLSITQPGGSFSQEVFVKFTPTANLSYDGNIPVSGGGATAINVAASGSGNDNPPTVNTGTFSMQPYNVITLNGSLTDGGCSPVTSYGIEYSGVSGFTGGHGTKIPSTNLTGTDFSVMSNSFVPRTTYYYRAYAINAGGTYYGDEQSFATDSLAAGLIIYSSPLTRGGQIHYSLNDIKPGHYQVKIFGINGQMLYQRDLIQQVNFINDRFTLPAQVVSGVYYLEISNHLWKKNKTFLVR
jgi:Lamin Tail Domain